jgi:hypothetical protein
MVTALEQQALIRVFNALVLFCMVQSSVSLWPNKMHIESLVLFLDTVMREVSGIKRLLNTTTRAEY